MKVKCGCPYNKNYCGVFLPDGLENKYPEYKKSFNWFYLFPAKNLVTGINKQYHIHETCIQKQIKYAIKKSGILKDASCHTFRHSFATDLLGNGTDIRTVQEYMGHRSLRSLQVYLHIIPSKFNEAISPMDRNRETKLKIYPLAS